MLARRPVLLTAAAIAVALVALAAIWARAVWTKVDALEGDIRFLESADAAALASGDGAEIAAFRDGLTEARQRLDALHSSLGPARFAAALAGWAPLFGDDLRAAPALVDRASADVDAAIMLVDGVNRLRQAFGTTSGTFDEAYRAFEGGGLAGEVSRARDLIRAARETLAGTRAAGQGLDRAGLAGPLGGYAARLAALEERLDGIAAWAAPASEAAQELGSVVTAAHPLLDLVDENRLGSAAQIDAVVKSLSALETAAAAAFRATQAANQNAPREIRDSAIGDDMRALELLLDGLQSAAAGGVIGLRATRPALDLFSASQGGLLSDGQRTLRAMALLDGERPAFSEALVRLDYALEKAKQARSQTAGTPWEALVTRLSGFAKRLRSGIALAHDFPSLAPELLGANGPRTYLVLGQTSDELRATGGFVSGIWTITFSRGALVDVQYRDVVEVDDTDRLYLYPRPPRLLEEYMSAPVWLMRDVSWEPDFPSTAQFAQWLYRLGQKRETDGVIAVTPWAFLGIARALGSISTAEGTLLPDALLPALEAGTDARGRAYMDTIFRGLLDSLDGASALERLLDLAGAVEDVLSEKQALVYLSNPDAEQLVRRYGWAGELSLTGSDRLVIVDSNVGWSKVDRNIERQADYRIVLHGDGPARARLTLGYRNLSGPGASGCDSQYMDRGLAYEVLKNACYWDLVRVYVAIGSELVSADPMPLPARSIRAQTGLGAAGEDTLEALADAGGAAFGGLLTVPPGEFRETTLVYDAPGTIVDWGREVSTYSLVLQTQPGTRGRTVSIEVVLPEGFEYAGSSMEPAAVSGNAVTFQVALRRDTVLTVEMRRDRPA